MVDLRKAPGQKKIQIQMITMEKVDLRKAPGPPPLPGSAACLLPQVAEILFLKILRYLLFFTLQNLKPVITRTCP